MNKFFTALPLHFKSALRSIKRSFATTLSSVFAVTVTLVLVSIFVITALSIQTFTKDVEDTIRVFVRIEPSVEVSQIASLQAQIESIPHVDSVTYSDKEEQFQKFLESDQGGDKYKIFEDDNPLPAAFYVEAESGAYVEQIAEASQQIEGIKDASFGGESSKNVIIAFNSIRIGGAIFVGVLSLLAVFLISNTIKININNRKEEIGIMRNVGANNWFIKMPFLIEGILIGMIGAILPILFTIFGYGFLYQSMRGQFFASVFQMFSPLPTVLYISLFLVLVGVVVGLIGSLLSVNKYLKWKR